MFLEWLLVGLLLGLLAKGQLANFVAQPVRRPALLFIGLGLQVVLLFSGLLTDRWAPLVIGLSYALVVAMLLANWRLPGFRLILAGVLLNVLVIAANGLQMPVDPAAAASVGYPAFDQTKHTILLDGSRLAFLADWIPLRPPYYPFRRVVSIGDLTLAVGLCRLGYGGTKALSGGCATRGGEPT